ncbi:MAG: delta-aminolevulinic acid dehydratase, partial [Chromatocurvus sp.]
RGPDYVQRARVWLQAEDYCRPPPELFPEGSTWVMALQRIDRVPEDGFNPNTPNVSYGRRGDYILSSCGGYWLKLTDNRVSGALVNSPRWARDPEMTPVLLELVDAHVKGRIDDEAIMEASREDPAVKELMLDTKEFLRSVQE